MRRLDIPNGWYTDALPTGEWACNIFDTHVLTEHGPVPLNADGNAITLCLDPTRSGRIACNGHAHDRAWEWDGSAWHGRGPAYGPYACLYDDSGTLHIVSACPPDGYHGGWRQDDGSGRLVTTEDSTLDPARRIFNFTTLGDITVGQGGDTINHGPDPVVILHAGVRYRLADGQCRFVRFRRAGSALSIAWVREDTRTAHIVWLDVSEIPSLPVDVPEVEPIPQPGVTPALGKRWIGAYKDEAKTLPGNCYVREPEPGRVVLLRRSDDLLLATMVPGTDSQEWVTPAGNHWPGLYAYVDAAHQGSIASAVQACRDQCARVLAGVNGPAIILCQMYGRNFQWKNEASLAALMGVYPEVAAAHPDLHLLYFSGPERRDGTGDHPQLIPWYEAACAAVTGEPEIDAPTPEPEPKPSDPEPRPEPEPLPQPHDSHTARDIAIAGGLAGAAVTAFILWWRSRDRVPTQDEIRAELARIRAAVHAVNDEVQKR